MSDPLEVALRQKQTGNDYFKKKEFLKAIQCYNEAVSLCPPQHNDHRAVFLKNRAACYLKLNQYQSALNDTSAALEINPLDVKSLYRHSQSLQGLGRLSSAFETVQKLLKVDPQNKEAIEMARKLSVSIRKQNDDVKSSSEIIKKMYEALEDAETPTDRKSQAAKNLAILSRESSGAEHIFQSGGIPRLLPLLESCVDEVVHHTLEVFVGLCSKYPVLVLQGISLDRLSNLITHPVSDICSSAVSLVKHALLSMTAQSAESTGEAPLTVPLIQMLLVLLLSEDVNETARDNILELLMTTCTQDGLGKMYLKEGAVGRLLQLAASDMAISEQSRTNVSLVFSKLYDCLGKDSELRAAMKSECVSFVQAQLSLSDVKSRVGGLMALSVLLQGVHEVGSVFFSEETFLSKIEKLAGSEDISCQLLVAEVLALAASDKARCQSIISSGLLVLQKLYSSSDDRVKVRALVGLCKLGSVGGSNVNARTFTEGSVLKLEKACRKLLISSKKGERIQKWAAEGLAFLSLDAEVKESLVTDLVALKVLLNMPKSNSADEALLYGLSIVLVNLTNSYEKPERNPELEELAKYAKENVPKEHELDGENYVRNRVQVLLKNGVVSTLVTLSCAQSLAVREQVARVFLALAQEVGNRGVVVQQGGAKCLVPLTSTNTPKGKLTAAQAIAKVAITNDPKLAFPGQRSLEVIRPLVQLLKSEHGLQQFEGLMALTNLAGMSDDTRRRIFKEGGVQLMESLMFEEHEMIRRAATEALCNMIALEEVFKRFYDDDIERVKLWTLFSGEEDPHLAKAAAGGLAQLSHDPVIANKVMAVKSAMDILKELVANDNSDLQYRGVYIVANLMEASKEIAEKFVGSEFLELLMAIAQSDATSEQVRSSASRALNKAVEYQLIQPNPQLLE